MPTPTPPAAPSIPPLPPLDPAIRATRFRWVILFLIFLGTTINYMDRQVMGVIGPFLQNVFGFSDTEYGDIAAAFALFYAFGQVIAGRWLDWIGTRKGYAIALAAWSLACMAPALAGTPVGTAIAHAFVAVWNPIAALFGWAPLVVAGAVGIAIQFKIARALLGVSESPAFPAATKTLAEWFPKKERALAFGFVNAGTNIGALLAPLMVPWLAITYGWQAAFLVTGGLGLVGLALWIPLYRRPEEHPRVNAAELAYIHSDPPEPTGKVRWLLLLTYPQTWSFAISKFLTDSIWWFHMTWIPKFLYDEHKLDLKSIGLPLIVVYLMADVGSIGGGWLSSRMIKTGMSINAARKITMLLSALAVVPIIFAAGVSDLWPAVVLVGLAVAAHQSYSSNLYTTVSDMFPRRAVASVAGLGGMCGYFGAFLFAAATGRILEFTKSPELPNGNYLILFVIAASAYLLAMGIMQVLVPRLQPANIGDAPAA